MALIGPVLSSPVSAATLNAVTNFVGAPAVNAGLALWQHRDAISSVARGVRSGVRTAYNALTSTRPYKRPRLTGPSSYRGALLPPKPASGYSSRGRFVINSARIRRVRFGGRFRGRRSVFRRRR